LISRKFLASLPRAALFTAALLCTLPGRAQDPPPPAEEGELEELMSIVEQETAVATKTRMNSDYVPGIVTVLNGDELAALGIATAGEALSLVPGMQAIRDPAASPSVITRGLDFPFGSGNIRILLNSVPLARSDAGFNTSVLLLPVEQIERIEVIRGPGSVVHGDFAFMGLVNIITRKDRARVFVRGTQPQPSVSVGGQVGWSMGKTAMTASLARFDTEDAYAAGSNRDEQRWFAIFGASNGGLDITAELVQRQFNQLATGAPGQGIPFIEESWAIEGRYARELAPKLRGEAAVSHHRNDIDVFTQQFDGSQQKAAANIVWDGWSRQSWLVGADYTSSAIDRGATRRAPTTPGAPPNPLVTLVTNTQREITGLVLQDTIDLTGSLKLTLGARHDRYSDLDSQTTPRAALVWRASERHIVKAQYAQGFRPPTFFERYEAPAPNRIPSYPFETNTTTELHYVYRGALSVARATVYRAVLSDLIRPGGIVLEDDATANGIELEWGRELNASWKMDANLSYVDTSDPRAGAVPQQNRIAAPVLGNLSVFYRPFPRVIVTSRWNHVGNPPAGNGYNTIDVTVSRNDLFLPGLSLRAGVRNAADSDVTFLQQRPAGDVTTFNYPGRSVWAQVSWSR
jgi:outer membrane receptor for ferrienterochelin and colicins